MRRALDLILTLALATSAAGCVTGSTADYTYTCNADGTEQISVHFQGVDAQAKALALSAGTGHGIKASQVSTVDQLAEPQAQTIQKQSGDLVEALRIIAGIAPMFTQQPAQPAESKVTNGTKQPATSPHP